MKPPPAEVLDKLLVPMHGQMLENKTQTEWAVRKLKNMAIQTQIQKIDKGTDPTSAAEIKKAQSA